MTATLQIPTPDAVKAACERFNRENALAEAALTELFRQYPGNSDPRHVLLKVVAVNSLYRTNIFTLDVVATHIHAKHAEIDAALAAGDPEIIQTIARVQIHGKHYNFFSFATKFASWHNPAAYPIYDAHVDNYLWHMQQQDHFAAFHHPDLWNYPKFLKILTDFRDFHNLGAFTFKEIDQFLYLEGAPPKSAAPDPQHAGPGAFDYYPAEESSPA